MDFYALRVKVFGVNLPMFSKVNFYAESCIKIHNFEQINYLFIRSYKKSHNFWKNILTFGKI